MKRRFLQSNFFIELWSCLGIVLAKLSRDDETDLSVIRHLSLHVLGLMMCSLVVFSNNSVLLFCDLDGSYMKTVVRHQHDWVNSGLSLPANPFQGLGNVFFPINSYLLPGHLLSSAFFAGEMEPIACYTIISVELFLALFLLWRSLRIRLDLALTASWVTTLLVMPFSCKHYLYPLTWMVPYFAEVLAWHCLVVSFFAMIGRENLTKSLVLGVAAAIVFTISSVAAPAMCLLTWPALLPWGIFLLSVADSRKEILAKMAFVCLVFVGSLPTLFPFVAGNALNSVPTFFAQELENDRAIWHYVSILFQNPITSHVSSFIGPLVFLLSIGGSSIAGLLGSGSIKRLGILNLILSMLIVLAGGLVTVMLKDWRGPSIVYFEFFAWPLYLLFASLALILILDSAATLCWSKLGNVFDKTGDSLTERIRMIPAVIFILILSCFTVLESLSCPRERGWKYPPSDTAITKVLRSELQLFPDSPFRGSVATFTCFSDQSTGVGWLDQNSCDGRIQRLVGNDHRMVGLWYYNIPTLQEYNPFMTPQYYLVVSRLLSRPCDRQMRTVVVLTAIHQSFLRSLGVRFLITDFPLPTGPSVREEMQLDESRSMYLYELSGANLGTYSPARAIVGDSAEHAIEHMTAPGFDFEKDVVISSPMGCDLVKASSTALQVLKDGVFRVRAASEGTSMLLLPLQFSHCLDLQVLHSSGGTGELPRLVRANLLLTGIVFSGSMEADISFRCSPLRNSCCRIRDSFDMKRLNVKSSVKGGAQ